VEQLALLPPTATADSTEPATGAFEEGAMVYKVRLPLIQR
jgi:hypothetical protein